MTNANERTLPTARTSAAATALAPTPPTPASTADDGPAVKVVYEWRVTTAAEVAFATWVHELLTHADRLVGLAGSSVLRSGDVHFVLLRFHDRVGFEAFEQHEATAALFERAERLADAVGPPQLRTGLETWFASPARAPLAPARWKMALVTWLALLPQVLLLAQVLPPMPFLLHAAVSTAIPVSMLTWVVMPRLSRWLAGWLYGPR